ncbi:hypothetical protein LXA43DRAFT_677937 [Ganoderma leucocontextum]|nr:hypothetical protein LXA43DRAFT_677937 [Ganoderma leucocontextum]
MSARTRKACVNCGRKKVRCLNEGDHRPCAKCEQGGRECVWPPPRPRGPQNKTACDACRKDRMRCCRALDQDDDRRCMNCQEKEVECSYPALQEEQVNDGHAEPEEPVAGPSNYPGALSVDRRPALTVDPTAGVDGLSSSSGSTSVSPITRTNSPSRGNWKEVCLAPSPEAETYEETLYEAYAAQ